MVGGRATLSILVSAPAHDPYLAFRDPNFRRYVIGFLIVQMGTACQGVALQWEIYQRTGSMLNIGLVGLVQAIPMLTLTLPSGYFADRYPRIRVMQVSLSLATLASLGLAYFSIIQGSIAWMYALLFLDAAFVTLGRPARTALLATLVPREMFESAVKWRTSLWQLSGVLGPAIGGIVVAWNVPAAYVISAVTSGVLLALLPGFRPVVEHQPLREPMLKSVAEGIRFVWSNKVVLHAISLDLFAVLLGGATYLLPVFASDILDVGAQGFGVLKAAPAVGALVMAIVLAHRPPMRRAGKSLLLAVAGFGVATIVFGLSQNFWLSVAALALTGAFDNVSVVVRHTLVQTLTPDAMRGRVSSVNAVFIGSSNELGGFESGLVASWFGPVISVVSGGIGTLVVVALTAWRAPALRRQGSLSGQ